MPSPTSTEQLDQRIAKLKAELKAQQKKKDNLAAKQKYAQEKAQRERLERQKLLLGGFMLDQLQKTGTDPASLVYQDAAMKDWLTHPKDKAVFGIEESDKVA